MQEINNPLTAFRFLKAVTPIDEPGAIKQAEIVKIAKMPKMQMTYNEVQALCDKKFDGFDTFLFCLN